MLFFPRSQRPWKDDNEANVQCGGNACEPRADGRGEQLTCVDEELVGYAWVIHVMDGAGKEGGQDFKVSENGLRNRSNGREEKKHYPSAAPPKTTVWA